MELKQGDIFKLTKTDFLDDNELGIVVNDGPSWLASPRGCYIHLRKQEDGSYKIGSIIKEQGPAVAMSTNKCYEMLKAIETYKGDILYGITRTGWTAPVRGSQDRKPSNTR